MILVKRNCADWKILLLLENLQWWKNVNLLLEVKKAIRGSIDSAWNVVSNGEIYGMITREARKFCIFLLDDGNRVEELKIEMQINVIELLLGGSLNFTNKGCIVKYFSMRVKGEALRCARKLSRIGNVISTGRIINKRTDGDNIIKSILAINNYNLDFIEEIYYHLNSFTKLEIFCLELYLTGFSYIDIGKLTGNTWVEVYNMVSNVKVFLRAKIEDDVGVSSMGLYYDGKIFISIFDGNKFKSITGNSWKRNKEKISELMRSVDVTVHNDFFGHNDFSKYFSNRGNRIMLSDVGGMEELSGEEKSYILAKIGIRDIMLEEYRGYK